ncbi:hypothetical protein DPEC_G00219190 [Dallia pectoralis]|uniref:Uncharacterized protein n=1 Tax=Dallia pectoralis TaxID=75939 RepID=A0ACC2G3A1_DALPE|nr:hypothetical protein DPEC_G00219190 [Dallia pectoralis]
MATSLELIGGNGGSPFNLTGLNNGATLKKIGVAVGGWQIKAVRAELTDGRVSTFGNANTFSEFEFSLGERITKLSLWGNGAGTRLGGIRFWTSTGREFFEHMNSWPLKTEYSIDVGSGVCLGVQGNGGSDIDNMGFLFINAIKTSVLTDMHYPNMAMFTPQVNKEYIKSVSYHNNTTSPQTQTIHYSRSVTKKFSWTTTNKIEFTISMSVKAGIPDLVEASAGYSLTVGHEQSSSMATEETITEADTTTVKIPPGKTVSVDMSVGRAVIDLSYSATVKVTCLNGSELVFPSTGNYNGRVNRSHEMATSLELIGGNGGSPFNLTGLNNGATLKKIGVAVEGWQIKAVRAELTDGRVSTFGNANTFSEFEFSLGERITKLSLWGNGAGTRLGGIRFWTSTGREFFEHMNSWPLKTEYSIDVGSGVCLGVQGNGGSDIDNMGFLFINAIKISVLTDMHYPNMAMFTPQGVDSPLIGALAPPPSSVTAARFNHHPPL